MTARAAVVSAALLIRRAERLEARRQSGAHFRLEALERLDAARSEGLDVDDMAALDALARRARIGSQSRCG